MRKLADGWLGPTCLAEKDPGARQVVVKSIAPLFLGAPEARSQLAALVTRMARLPEEGIIKLLSCTGEQDGSVLLAMPFVDAENLAEHVAKRPGKTPSPSLQIVREIALLLAASHQAGLHHLALRPSQVLIRSSTETERGISVHLLGLGLLEALGWQRPRDVPEPQRIYLAPEQSDASTAAKIDERTDVYGLGVLLLYLLLGKKPSPEEVDSCRSDAERLLAGRVIRDDTARLLQRMLAPDPSQRPTMQEVGRALGTESQAPLLSTMLAPKPVAGHAVTEQAESALAAGITSRGVRDEESEDPHQGILFGNFRIIRRIGRGGMGVVYEAEHKQIGRRAAVKILHPQFAQSPDYANRFLNEARAVNIIRHPGLVEIFEYGQQPDGTLYIVMEFLPGESLRARLQKQKEPHSVVQIMEWAVQIARALSATHAKGIIHRDLKPENIMVVPDPLRAGQDWVKLLDFGVAKLSAPRSAQLADAGPSDKATDTAVDTGADTAAETGPDTASDTAMGTVMGTPIYMAPEQHFGAAIVDGMADVFSFGVMLYEMLSGKRPYKEVALSLRTTPAVSIDTIRADTPKELATLILRMLSLLPAERPPIAEVEAQLTALLGQEKKRRRSSPFLLIGGILAILFGLSGFLGYRLLRPLSLAEARERALTLVKRSLTSAEQAEELQATQALGKSRDIEYRPLLEPLLAAKRPALVAAAARGLGEMSAIESQPALLSLLEKTNDANVRMEAAAALALLSHPKGVDTLRSLLQKGDDLTKMEAALRLLEHSDRSGAALLHRAIDHEEVTNERAIPVLAALARTGDQQARQRLSQHFQSSVASGKSDPFLAFSLARLGDAAAHRQLLQLAGRAGPEQVVAARFLSALGQPDGYAVLVKTGADGQIHERLREIAFDGLGDSNQADAASVLARTLTESAVTMRLRLSAAGSVLELASGAVGAYASRSLSWARSALGSDSSATRELAVMLLADLESDAAIAPLRLALKDKEREVRSGAARALGRKSVRIALDALADALSDSEEDVRSAGMKSIGQVVAALRKKGEQNFEADTIAKLNQMMEKGTAVDRIVAAGTLLRMGDGNQRNLLREGLRATDTIVRRMAVELMDAEPALLLEGLKDLDGQVRFAAARRLAALGHHECVAVLRATLSEGGPEGLTAYSLLKKLGETAEPPADLLALLAGRSLRGREAVLEVLSELPPHVALELLLRAANDASNMIRRRAAEVAADFYFRTMQIAFRNLLLELRNDADVVVRSRVAELVAKLPPATAGSSSPKEASLPPEPGPTAAPPEPAAPLKSDAVPPSMAPAVVPVTPAEGVGGKLRGKAAAKPTSATAVTASKPKEDPRAKTMGLIQIYVVKNGRCQLVNQYYLPPGDHIVNVDGGSSQTVSVYAGMTIPVRQCP